MPQAKPIQRQPMLPTFLDTSQETVRTSSNRNPGLKDLVNSVFVLQITSGITLGLALGQLLIIVSFMSKPVVTYSLPRSQPSAGAFINQ
jgi:hypothetical protein